jgi:surfeit locus 1 family protein
MLFGCLSGRIVGTIYRAKFSNPVAAFGRPTNCLKLRVRYSGSDAGKKVTVRSLKDTGRKDFDARGYILLFVPITAFCLGTWQIQRRKWKLGVIEELEWRTTAKPVPLPLELSEIPNLEYCRVVVRGRFDHSKELHIMPRAPVEGTLPEEGFSSADRKVHRAHIKTGANIVTAFVVDSDEHPGMRILVNRGWVPRDKIDPATRMAGQIEGPIELTGVVRLAEKAQQMVAANNPTSNQWFSRDVDAMAEALGTSPIFIDADRKSTVPGGPFGGQTLVTLRNEHMSYIITWYSLAAFTFFMWMKAYWR